MISITNVLHPVLCFAQFNASCDGNRVIPASVGTQVWKYPGYNDRTINKYPVKVRRIPSHARDVNAKRGARMRWRSSWQTRDTQCITCA